MNKNFFDGLDKIGYKTTLSALGVNKNKALIAIVASQNALSVTSCNSLQLANWVADGVRNNDFDAKVFSFPDFCGVAEGSSGKNIQQREFAEFFVKSLGESLLFDGFVFVCSDVFAASGMLKGALSCNLPCLFLGNGKMSASQIEGNRYGLADLYGVGAQINSGKLSPAVKESVDFLIKDNFGNDPYCHCANSGIFMTQALGLQLAGTASVLEGSLAQYYLAQKTGTTICELVVGQCTPQKMLKSDSFKTAMAVDLALGGSCNTLINLFWLTADSSDKLSYKQLNKMSATIPAMVDTTQAFDVEKFEQSGGVFAVINQLSQAAGISTDYLCFANVPMREFCKDFLPQDYIISFSASKVLPSSFLLEGNLATSALAFPTQKSAFVGNAKVFDNQDAIVDAVLTKQIKHGDCIVLTYCGPKGGLSCPFKAAAALNGAGLSSSVAFVTDGIVPDFFKGISVSLVCPEAYDDGAIAYIRDGDRIEINLVKGKLNTDIKAKDLAIRRKQTEIKKIMPTDANFLFCKVVSSAEEGCQLKFTGKER